MGEQSHLSIGEVLSLLQEEFPDVTISKIRFLESQGLLDPERTPSGYRKFYEGDIDKLRWILTEQRDHFLPLKVIRDRLADNGGKIPSDEIDDEIGGNGAASAGDPAPAGTVSRDEGAGSPGAQPVWMADHARRSAAITTPPVLPAPSAPTSSAVPSQATLPLDAGPSTVSFTFDELLAATRLTAAQARSLEQYGLLASRQVGPDLVYDAESVIVAQKAATFFGHGVEARHLRMYKVAAEREAGFLEQVVTPMLKQRNPAARRQAVELLNELLGLGDAMHASLLRQALHGYLSPPI